MDFVQAQMDNTSTTTRYTISTVAGITFLFQSVIGILTFKGMYKNEGINPKLKYLFITGFVCTCTSLASMISLSITNAAVLWVIFLSTASYFYICLLATLVARLHLTFKGTIYEMSKWKRYVSITLLILLFLNTLRYPVQSTAYHDYYLPGYTYISVFMLVFIIGSALAVREFARNIHRLTESRHKSMMNVNRSLSDIRLDEQQKELIDVSARYTIPFSVAAISTVVTGSLVTALSLSSGQPAIYMMLDQSMNLLCIYLQHKFAENHYKRCCGSLDRRCKEYISRRTKKSLHARMMIRKARAARQRTPSFSTGSAPMDSPSTGSPVTTQALKVRSATEVNV